MSATPLPVARPSAVDARIADLQALAEERADRAYAYAGEIGRLKGLADHAVAEIDRVLAATSTALAPLDRLALATVSALLAAAVADSAHRAVPVQGDPAPASRAGNVVTFASRRGRHAR